VVQPRKGHEDVKDMLIFNWMNFKVSLLEDQVLTYNTLPDIPYILDHGLEMRDCIIRASDKDVVGFAGML
jgi:hypothetical protein